MTAARAATAPLPLRLPPWRARLVLFGLLAGFVLLGARAVYLQGLNSDFLQGKGESRYGRVLDLPATRGIITDRNNEPLAVSTPVESVWASPADVTLDAAHMARLSQTLDMPPSEIRARLADTSRDFVYLKRQLSPEDAQKVMAVDVPGLFLQREYRRYYPAGDSAAHLVGLTNVDGRGQEGMELALDGSLAGHPGSRRVIKDRLGHIVEDAGGLKAARPGQDAALSIDANLQYLAYRELDRAVTANRAHAGSIVVLDVQTGEVLAMANLPSYNPNSRDNIDPARTRNRAVTDVFEPGSTLKPFTAAAALESGLFKPDSVIQTAPGKLIIGDRTIHDAHPEGALTVTQVIQKSSNVGAAKMALSLPSDKLWSAYNRAGFGALPRSGLPGETTGRLREYTHWRPIDKATLSYGHGISINLLQLARAYLIFATDGGIRPVSVFKQNAPPITTAVVDPAVAREVRAMLERVVEPGGTAPAAQITGYTVAGKTGTAHKLDGNGGYASDKYVSSFVGFAPASHPRLIIAVMIDEPTAGQYYGGTVAAPVFSAVMAGALRMLGVPPDAPGRAAPAPDTPVVQEDV